ncbi:MAG: PD-(D/E)XK nuclease family protein, partial [Phycisphaerales bacterium]|nr:PD-(D/E)XK nuclease family protein [Phycisphaerales bacterium]
ARRRASDMLREIISASGLLHHDLPDRSTHSARVRALSRAHAFVRDREDLLDHPATLFEYAEYHAILEVGFGATDEERDEPKPDAVQLLTAHAAKGLEFDVVILLRVRRPKGHFLWQGDADDSILALPDAIRYDDGQEAVDRRRDETRRLLYVACTRARHRLALFSKAQKTNNDEIGELLSLADPVPSLDADDLIASDDGAMPTPPLAADRDDALRHAELHVRLQASSILDRATRGDDVGSDLEDAARRLALIGAVRRGEDPIEIAPESSFARALHRRVGVRIEPTFRPMAAPLHLSYTMINDFERCARCMYVKNELGFREADTGKARLGTIVHDVLHHFGTWQREADIGERDAPTLDEVLAAGRDAFHREWPAGADDEDVESRIEGFLARAYQMISGEPQVEELEKTIHLTYHHRGAHRLEARIDRIERLADGRYRVIDFKTGRRTRKAVKDDLQLGIYAIAMARWGIEEDPVSPEADLEIPPGSAEYWNLGTDEITAIDLHEIALPKIHRKIVAAIDGCLDGRYPQGSDRTCSGLCHMIPE